MSSLDDVDDYDPNYKPAPTTTSHTSSSTTSTTQSHTTTDTNDTTTDTDTKDSILDDFFAELTDEEKNLHVNRILKCIRIDPFAVLDIPLNQFDSDSAVQKQYKKLSLVVHPDKNPHNKQNAELAFSLLGKAKNDILDPDKHNLYMSLLQQSYQNISKSHNNNINTHSDKYIQLVRAEFTEQLIIDQWKLRQQSIKERNHMVQSHHDKQSTEQLQHNQQLHKLQLMQTTDKRIHSWRDFQKNKLKKPKIH